jgi:hypothetical protein
MHLFRTERESSNTKKRREIKATKGDISEKEMVPKTPRQTKLSL